MRDAALHEQLDALLECRETRSAVIAALAAIAAVAGPAPGPLPLAAHHHATPHRLTVRHTPGDSDRLADSESA